MNTFLYNDFIFSSRYRVWRHIFFWSLHITIWAAFWYVIGVPLSYGRQLLNMFMWTPCFIFFSYPLVYGAIPHLLLKGKVLQFFLLILAWGTAGLYIDVGYRHYVLIPAQEAMGLDNILPKGPLAFCYLCMTTSAAGPMVLKFFKLWTIKQRQWIQQEKEKTTTELQLLKAQVHPHFLFNTLNDIHASALTSSSKTPELILKLSSLLSYMLYDCKTEEVRLEKELEVMKNYIDLEKVRYENQIEISWSVEGEIKDKLIAPLLLLPFLENAFKYGASEQVEKPWLGVDILVRNGTFHCKIINSKNDAVLQDHWGTGISNVKKRLDHIYPRRHELKINDEGDFFVVSIQVQLFEDVQVFVTPEAPLIIAQSIPA